MCSETAFSVCGAHMSLQFPHGNVEADQVSALNRQSILVDQRSFSTEVVAVCDYLALAIAGSFMFAIHYPGSSGPWMAHASMLTINLLAFMLGTRVFRSHAEGALEALPSHILRTLSALGISFVVTFGILWSVAGTAPMTLPMLGWW